VVKTVQPDDKVNLGFSVMEGANNDSGLSLPPWPAPRTGLQTPAIAINYEGYCPGCGAYLAGALIDGEISAVILK